jgi:hypothetical protein
VFVEAVFGHIMQEIVQGSDVVDKQAWIAASCQASNMGTNIHAKADMQTYKLADKQIRGQSVGQATRHMNNDSELAVG